MSSSEDIDRPILRRYDVIQKLGKGVCTYNCMFYFIVINLFLFFFKRLTVLFGKLLIKKLEKLLL